MVKVQAVEVELGSAVMGLPDGLKWNGKPSFSTAMAKVVPGGGNNPLKAKAWSMYTAGGKHQRKKKK